MPKRTTYKAEPGGYDEFISKSTLLIKRLGITSIDLIEILLEFSENQTGNQLVKARTISLILKEIQKILPRQFSIHAISGSRIVILVDSLMSVFFVEKIKTIIKNFGKESFSFSIDKSHLSVPENGAHGTENNQNNFNAHTTENIINETLKNISVRSCKGGSQKLESLG